jgi:hypothetical protein
VFVLTLNRVRPFLLLAAIVLLALTLAGCVTDRSEAQVQDKKILAYEDILQSLKNKNLKPKKSDDMTKNYSLNGVEPKIIKLSNGNTVEAFIYTNPDEATKAHQEFNDKTANADFLIVPQLYEVKNVFIIYFDQQFTDVLHSLRR